METERLGTYLRERQVRRSRGRGQNEHTPVIVAIQGQARPDWTRHVLRFPRLRNISQDLRRLSLEPRYQPYQGRPGPMQDPSASRGQLEETDTAIHGTLADALCCVIHTEMMGGKQKIEPRSLSHHASCWKNVGNGVFSDQPCLSGRKNSRVYETHHGMRRLTGSAWRSPFPSPVS